MFEIFGAQVSGPPPKLRSRSRLQIPQSFSQWFVSTFDLLLAQRQLSRRYLSIAAETTMLHVSIPQNTVVLKEIEMRGTFRFHEEFGLVVDFINPWRTDMTPLGARALTGVFGVDEAIHAMATTGVSPRGYSSC